MGNLPNVLSADPHPFRVTTSLATNTGAQKTSSQTNPRARLHQGDADFCAGGASGYSCFIPPGAPSRPWQLIRTPPRGFVPWRFADAGRAACGNVRDGRRLQTFTKTDQRRAAQTDHLTRFPHTPLDPSGKGDKDQGVSVLPTRKPSLRLRNPAVPLRRKAARSSPGSTDQEPPRRTRRLQSPVVQAEPSEGAPA